MFGVNQLKRLQKYISECGYTSRRKAEELIAKGVVTVNDIVVTEAGTKVSETDEVKINGIIIKPQKKRYIMLNKPSGYITAVSDDRGRKTVVELVKDIPENLFPVGRLDYDTEGLLILTSDGDFANNVIHPSKKMIKTYVAKLDRLPDKTSIELLKKGVEIEDYIAVANDLFVSDYTNNECVIKITSGKNRQVRKMFDHINCRVMNLKRISIGELSLGDLKIGQYRNLTEAEIQLFI